MKFKSFVSMVTAEMQIDSIFFAAQTQTESDAKKAHIEKEN